MKTARVILAAIVLAGALAIGRSAFTRHAASLHSATLAASSVGRAPGFSELAMRDEQIAVWKKALDSDPVSAIAMTQLAALHMQRARESGNYQDYITAEAYARKSLSKRTQRNGPAAVTLVSILLAQHRFTDARDIAKELVDRESDIPQYRSLLGEVSIEVGDYATASIMFDSVWTERAHLSNAPRLARWLELNNHVPEARRMLIEARDDAMARMDVAKEQKAWFDLRLGDLELRSEHLRAAEKAFRAGLDIEPADPRLMSAMARLSAANNDNKAAIEWGERAIAEQLDPATLGIVGDAYAAMGDSAKSNEYFHTLEIAVTQQPGAYHRAWSLYLLDHNLRVNEVLGKAQDELKDRKDIYGYDIVAWALHKAGRNAEAEAMMKQALRLDTQDPLLQRHQAAIKAALPITTAAR
ncbi:MAG: tetratricopeptide repeat protein [Gemmatimonadota bacterium]|nr:tetratricopeptide repeat protein [Gemmatimonadota bacterium]